MSQNQPRGAAHVRLQRLVALGVLGLASGLAACQTTQINALLRDTERCHVTLNYSAAAGVANIGSGAQVQGSVDCPPLKNPQPIPLLPRPGEPLGPAAGSPGSAETPAPNATFLQR